MLQEYLNTWVGLKGFLQIIFEQNYEFSKYSP